MIQTTFDEIFENFDWAALKPTESDQDPWVNTIAKPTDKYLRDFVNVGFNFHGAVPKKSWRPRGGIAVVF